jgi:hypothetical protein
MRGPQDLLQMSDGTRPQLSRRFDGDIQSLGNLRMREAVPMTHLDDLPMTWRQLGNGLDQLLVKFSLPDQEAGCFPFLGEGVLGRNRPGNFPRRGPPPGIAIPPRLVDDVTPNNLR